MRRRIRIVVSYDGTGFHGWQVQPGLRTVQSELEAAVGAIEGSPVKVEGSGRTDAGVHAHGVCAAFFLENPIPPQNLRKALNRLLAGDVRVHQVEVVPKEFHPRFDAIAKTYEYRIWREEVCPPQLRFYVLHHPYPLHEGAMMEAAAVLAGTHDFRAFATADPSDVLGKDKTRTVFSSLLERQGELLVYRVRGNGFLKHMVRHMVGLLLEVGKGNLAPGEVARYFKPGAKVIQTAPALGLHQMSVEYPDPS
jgi:tRNA pseudouridine38-40 synthase